MSKEQLSDKKSPEQTGNSENTDVTTKPKSVKPETRKPGVSVAALALVISIGALGLSGYTAWRTLALENSQPALVADQEQLQTQIARQQARLIEAVRAITPLEESVTAQQERSQRLLERTDQLSYSLNALAGTSLSGWKLAEVEYLLVLANQRLLMNADTNGALSLLKSADAILVELDDFKFYSVRSALAEDIALITTLPEFDQEGLYLQLDALSRQIATLPLMERSDFEHSSTARQKANTETTSAEPTDTSDWKTIAVNVFKNTVNSFVSLFRFTSNREQPVKALLSSEESLLIRQNLQLILEQAKLAILSRNQTVYDNSLQQAINWINNYFILSGSSASSMIAEIKELQSVVVKPSLPNITHALDVLKTLQEVPADDEFQTAPELPESPSPNTGPANNAETESLNSEGLFVPEGAPQS